MSPACPSPPLCPSLPSPSALWTPVAVSAAGSCPLCACATGWNKRIKRQTHRSPPSPGTAPGGTRVAGDTAAGSAVPVPAREIRQQLHERNQVVVVARKLAQGSAERGQLGREGDTEAAPSGKGDRVGRG